MKSYVTIEQGQCPVCGKVEDTGAVLMDRRLKDRFEHSTLTGFHLCKEHQQKADAGYIALIELKDEPAPGANTLQDTWPLRTGNLAHIRREAFTRIFNVPAPQGPLCFMQVGVIEKLQAVQHPADRAGL